MTGLNAFSGCRANALERNICFMMADKTLISYVFERTQKKTTYKRWSAQSANDLDRSGEKPYCTFIICIRFHVVNNKFENALSCLDMTTPLKVYVISVSGKQQNSLI